MVWDISSGISALASDWLADCANFVRQRQRKMTALTQLTLEGICERMAAFKYLF
jgi:hypothetical protein